MGRLSTVDLLVKLTGFAKQQIMFGLSKAVDLNWFVQGGQWY